MIAECVSVAKQKTQLSLNGEATNVFREVKVSKCHPRRKLDGDLFRHELKSNPQSPRIATSEQQRYIQTFPKDEQRYESNITSSIHGIINSEDLRICWEIYSKSTEDNLKLAYPGIEAHILLSVIRFMLRQITSLDQHTKGDEIYHTQKLHLPQHENNTDLSTPKAPIPHWGFHFKVVALKFQLHFSTFISNRVCCR